MTLHFSNSFYEFLHRHSDSNRVAEYLRWHNDSFYRQYLTDAECDYLTLRDGMITYCPAGKEQTFNADGTWRRENRQIGKPAKVARKLFTKEGLARLCDKDFEDFANRVKADNLPNQGEFRLVSGDDIRAWYNGNRYDQDTGSLQSSCMRYEACQDYFGLYTENPDKVKMLIFVGPEGLLRGRALVWETDQGTVMDRIYGNDAMIEAFRDYATDHGWAYRTYNTYDNPEWFTINGEPQSVLFQVDLDRVEFAHYPYVDTFKSLSLDGYVRNRECGLDYELTSTSGRFYSYLPIVCEDCGDEVPRNDAYYDDDDEDEIPRWCRACYEARFYETCVDCHTQFHASHHALDEHGRCYYCRVNNEEVPCGHCQTPTVRRDLTHGYCQTCWARRQYCQWCGAYVIAELDTEGRCPQCVRDNIHCCPDCGTLTRDPENVRNGYCNYCFTQRALHLPTPFTVRIGDASTEQARAYLRTAYSATAGEMPIIYHTASDTHGFVTADEPFVLSLTTEEPHE